MSAAEILDLLWLRIWWRYFDARNLWFSAPYHAFNLFEGGCWLVIAGLVLGRYFLFRQSIFEIVYALAFFTFGLTDFREAYLLESWLVWVKLVNLIVLIRMRHTALTRWYPGRRLF